MVSSLSFTPVLKHHLREAFPDHLSKAAPSPSCHGITRFSFQCLPLPEIILLVCLFMSSMCSQKGRDLVLSLHCWESCLAHSRGFLLRG